MKSNAYLAAGIIVLFSTPSLSLAGDISNIINLNNKSEITLNGYVDKIIDEREFRLRDDSGDKIGVDITSNESLSLKEGDPVTVSGTVDHGITRTNINAHEVTVKKTFAKGLSDAVRGLKGISTTDAQAFNISDLPHQGMVKISGTVVDVDNEKEFTVRDETGAINVDIISSQNAVVTKGAEVTVIGVVDNGLFSKCINATEVLVVSNSKLSANY